MALPRRKPRQADDRQASLPLTKRTPAPTKAPAKMTDELVAEKVTARDPSPPGLPHLAEIPVRLVLPRPVLVKLRMRAMRENKRLEGLIRELIEAAVHK